MAMMTRFSKLKSLQDGHTGPKISTAKEGPSCESTKVKLPGSKPTENKSGSPAEQPHAQNQWLPRVGENIELLSQDSGMRGCWLRCMILRLSRKNLMKVQYLDMDEVDEPGKLEEWVPTSRVAAPDGSGMRCAGQLTVRPCPDWDSTDFRYQIGMAVDAWRHDGWWECVVLGRDMDTESGYQVFLPGEKEFITAFGNNMRISKDWVGNEWLSLERMDILAFLTESLKPVITRTPLSVANNHANNSIPSTNTEVPSSSVPRDDKGKSPSLSNLANQKAAGELNMKKQPIIREDGDSSRKSTNDVGKGIRRKGKTVKRDSSGVAPTYIIALPVQPRR